MCRNVWFSLASTAIVSACIFLFCVFFSIITNIEYMVTMAETTMGITVFFDEDLSEAEIQALGEQIKSDKASLIKDMNFISARKRIWRRASRRITRWRVRLLTKSF